MARRSKRPASRGSVNNMILKALSAGDKYGYEIIKEVEEESDGKIVLKQPSLYSSLSRFETKGFVSSYWEDSEIGGRRHYYSLTPEGKEYYTKFVLKEADDEEDDALEEATEEISEAETEQEQDGYEYDQNLEDEKIEQSFTKYNFNVQDKINELLGTEESAEEIEEDASFDTQLEDDEDQAEETEEDTAEEMIETEEESSEEIIEQEEAPVIEEQKSAREQLKEIYNSIVNSNKPVKKQKEEPLTKRPLTQEELQRRKESMQILYGQSPEPQAVKTSQEPVEDVTQNKKEKLFQASDYLELVEESNKIAKNNTLFVKETSDPVEQPKKRFVVDEFGIMKIAEDIPEKKQKVFDNVGYRTTDTGHNVTEYKPPLPKPSQVVTTTPPVKQNFPKVEEVELSPEERSARQERFNERFANLQKERIEQRDSNIENIVTDFTPEANDGRPPSTFKNKNVKLFRDLPTEDQPEDNIISMEENDSNIEMIEEELERVRTNSIKTKIENNDNSILELQKELINKGVEFKSYSKESTIRKDRDFLLHNKLKFALGLILLFLMAIETTAFLFVSKNMGFYLADNKILFIAAYVITGIVAAALIVPYIFSPHKRKINNFRFGYNFLFGLFAFILTAILSYALNTLVGLKPDNLNYYLTSLLLPMVLAVNFVIVPFIYSILLKTKAFY